LFVSISNKGNNSLGLLLAWPIIPIFILIALLILYTYYPIGSNTTSISTFLMLFAGIKVNVLIMVNLLYGPLWHWHTERQNTCFNDFRQKFDIILVLYCFIVVLYFIIQTKNLRQ